MCGLIAILTSQSHLSSAELTTRIEAMTGRLVHRGPDASGAWTDEAAGIALGHRRLSIIDLSEAGAQPMASADGRWVIAYNGELYNTAELRASLPGVNWRGHSDTEVLVEGIARWGVEETLRRATAMLAIAVWDTESRELWLARDRFGEKPLYYGRVADTWVVASELTAFHGLPGFSTSINREAVAALLQFGSIPGPLSIYSGVHKLPAGNVVRLRSDDSTASPQAYWDPTEVAGHTPRRAPDANFTDELAQLLHTTVGARMVADVPLGAFLSGGVDSSLVVALMQQQAAEAVQTFTIGFEQAEYDESGYARRVAEHLGTRHTELRVSSADAQAVVPLLPRVYSEPFADSSQIPTYLVSQLARQQVTVALSGDGGDELFGGYDRYRVIQKLERSLGQVPQVVTRAAGAGLGAVPAGVWNAISQGPAARLLPGIARRRPGQKAAKLARLLGAPVGDRYRVLMSENLDAERLVLGCEPPPLPDIYRLGTGSLSVGEQAMLADTLTYLPDDLLVKVDRASMAHSLEVRVPLLDPDLFAFAWSLGPEHRFADGTGKGPLRQVLRRYLPDELIDRPKMGFGVPISAWLRGPLRGWAEDLLEPQLLAAQGYLDPVPVRALWTEHLSGRSDHGPALWPILMFQAWLQEWHP